MNKLNTIHHAGKFKLSWTECVQFVMFMLTAADDSIVTIDDDTSEASMMRMMGFSDFNSTKVSLHVLKITKATVKFDFGLIHVLISDSKHQNDFFLLHVYSRLVTNMSVLFAK